MRVLSLFDGISCARVALERAGIPVEVYYASEIDKYAEEISFKNYPANIPLGDVKKISFVDSLHKPNIDLLIGGSPCQDLSIAKANRKGLDGARSGLFWEYVRILKEVKPKYFILENVNSMPKEAKQLITETLGVEPIMINAALVSAQNRKRLFWVGTYNEKTGVYNQVYIEQPQDRGIFLKDILEKNVKEPYIIDTRQMSREKKPRIYRDGKTPTLNASMWKEPYRVGQIGKGGQGDRIYSSEGKSVGLSALGGGRGAKTGLYEVDSDIRKLTPIECERLQGLPDNYTEGVSNTQRYKALGNAFNVDVVAHILKFIPK